ncbi:helix-turn-helix domain-containing protein [Agrococcus jejuensis]|uniref:Helix-turn-helix n=1 Tax=Agrococcus jejuensis TaxID=399736 RepID=A0A1G8EZM8_9MICO|nr:helix-turn-helix transcriptional regulator [Agrococcus jejuensis]SDH75333.1 Helix-turn-helix [Agrococcus jejuensis]
MQERDRVRGNDIGPAGKTVGDRVRRVRESLEWTQHDLSRVLTDRGRPIPVSSIGRIESGQRKVDVDDLLALALALDVSPLSLLLPFTQRWADYIDTDTIGTQVPALDVWRWALGVAPLGEASSNDFSDVANATRDFQLRSYPWWLEVDADINHRMLEIDRRFPSPPLAPGEKPDPLYEGDDGSA